MSSLSKERVIQFVTRKKTPFLTFTREREETKRIVLSKEAYDDRRDRYISRIKSVLDYAREENICRSQILLSYFGEKDTQPCGKCDICLKNRENQITTEDFENIRKAITANLETGEMSLNSLVKSIPFKEKKVLQVARFMLDNNLIEENNLLKLKLIKSQ